MFYWKCSLLLNNNYLDLVLDKKCLVKKKNYKNVFFISDEESSFPTLLKLYFLFLCPVELSFKNKKVRAGYPTLIQETNGHLL